MRTSLIALTAAVAAIPTAGIALAETATSPGTAKVTFTSPKAYVGPARTANISCSTGASYVMRFGRTTKNGQVVNGALRIPVYTGPGDYIASVAMTVRGSAGSGAGTLRSVPVTITETGGTAKFSRALSGARAPKLAGKVFAGTVQWTCPTTAA